MSTRLVHRRPRGAGVLRSASARRRAAAFLACTLVFGIRPPSAAASPMPGEGAAGAVAAEGGGRPTPAGTRVVNAARVRWRSANGEVGEALSDSVEFVVGRVAGVDVEPPRSATVPAGRTVVLAHRLENLGNAADTFRIEATADAGWPTRVYVDADGDGVAGPAERVADGVVVAALYGAVPLLVAVDVPLDAVSGVEALLTVEAWSLHDADARDRVVDRLVPEGGSSGLALESGPDRIRAAAGDVLTWTLRWTVDRRDGPGRLEVVDTLPATLRYLPGSLELEGAPLTDAADDDAGSARAEAGVLRIVLDPADGLTRGMASFQATVEPGTPPGTTVSDRAAAAWTGSGGSARVGAAGSVEVDAASLELVKTAEGGNTAAAGAELAFRLAVRNPSELHARSLVLVDTVPGDLEVLTTSPRAEAEGAILRWSIDEVAPSDSFVVRVRTRVRGSLAEDRVTENRAHLDAGHARLSATSGPLRLLAGEDSSHLSLEARSSTLQARLGERISTVVTVLNDGSTLLSDARARVTLSPGVRLVEGSVRLLGAAGDAPPPSAGLETASSGPGDPAGAATAGPGARPGGEASAGRPFPAGSLTTTGDTLGVYLAETLRPGEARSFRYSLEVTGSPTDGIRTRVTAEAIRPDRGQGEAARVLASAPVVVRQEVRRNRSLETRAALGRVWVDLDGDGTRDANEPGVEGVDVWTEDGRVSATDAEGRFSFTDLRPGRHAYRLDGRTLPVAFRAADGDDALEVRTSTGWTTPVVEFPVVPRLAVATGGPLAGVRLACVAGADAPAPSGPSAPADRCRDPGADTAGLPGDLPPEVVVAFRPDGRGWPEVVHPLPAGWTPVAGSSRLAGEPAPDPEVVADRDGSRWLLWRLPGRVPGPLRLGLRTVPPASPDEVVSLEPLRAAAERESDGKGTLTEGPGIVFFAPEDGAVLDTDRLYVGVRGEPLRSADLFVDDSLLASVTLRPDGVHDFVGVGLERGPRTLRVRTTNSWGRERWDSLRVHVTGAPERIVPESPDTSLAADGLATARLRFRVRDRWDVPVANLPLVTVEADGVSVRGRDADPSSVGLQLRATAAGWLEVEVQAGRRVGVGRVRARYGDARGESRLTLLPPNRPFLLTGVGEVSLGAGSRDFGAVTATGRIDDRTAVTLTWDSRRLDDGTDVFGRDGDPLGEGRWAVLGDDAERRVRTASRSRLSARVERDLDWVQVGDVAEAGFNRDLRLSGYARSVTGVAGEVGTGPLRWDAFAALTRQSLETVQIRGDGTSGPYRVDGSMVPGTERVSVQVRAMDNASRTLTERALSRWLDYQVDYEEGRILLDRPVPATDGHGNPVYVVVSWESEDAGESSAVWGVRASMDLAGDGGTSGSPGSLPVGLTVVRDGRSDGSFRLVGADAAFARGPVELEAEAAWAEGADSSDLALHLEGRVELLDGALELGGAWTRVGDRFSNPGQPFLLGGTEELRGEAAFSAAGSTVRLRHGRQVFPGGFDRERTSLGVERSLGERFRLDARYAQDRSAYGGTEDGGGAGEARLTWTLHPKVDVWAEGRGQLWSSGAGRTAGDFLGAGARVRVTGETALELRHVEVRPESGDAPYSLSSAGLRSRLAGGTTAWGRYQLLGGVDGAGGAAVAGVNHVLHLGSHWQAHGLLERRVGVERAPLEDPVRAQPFARDEEDAWSTALGITYAPSDGGRRLEVRAEAREGETTDARVLTARGSARLDRSWTILTRQEHTRRSGGVAGAGDRRTTRSLVGLALRPAGRGGLDVLFKADWLSEERDGTGDPLDPARSRRRIILAAEAAWSPLRGTLLSGRYALRQGREEDSREAGHGTGTDAAFAGLAAEQALGGPLGLRLEGRALLDAPLDLLRWSLSPALSLRPTGALEVLAGYRLGDLDDPDFAAGSAGAGFFLTLGLRVTENGVADAAAFWRDRLARP